MGLLAADIRDEQARSIKCQMTTAKLPPKTELQAINFEATDINETLIRDLASGDSLDQWRTLGLDAGTGSGKANSPSVSP